MTGRSSMVEHRTLTPTTVVRSHSPLPATQHYMLRLTRLGPLVPARIRWIDHAPQDPPENKLDRGRLSVLSVVDIAGVEVPPEELTERFNWPVGHWKFAQAIDEARYRFEFARLRWVERNRPTDPVLTPRRAVDPAQMVLPSFERENAI